MFGGVIGWIVVALLDPTPAEAERRAAQSSPAPFAAPVPERVCPWCAETIKAAAVICRFCNRAVEPVMPPPPAPVVMAEAVIPDDRWLADPLGHGAERLWNGANWTRHLRDHDGAHWSDDDPALATLAAPTELRPV